MKYNFLARLYYHCRRRHRHVGSVTRRLASLYRELFIYCPITPVEKKERDSRNETNRNASSFRERSLRLLPSWQQQLIVRRSRNGWGGTHKKTRKCKKRDEQQVKKNECNWPTFTFFSLCLIVLQRSGREPIYLTFTKQLVQSLRPLSLLYRVVVTACLVS